MKLLKNIFVFSIIFVVLNSLNAVSQNTISDQDRYNVIRRTLEIENPGQGVIFSIKQLRNPLTICALMELFFRFGDESEKQQIKDYLLSKGDFVNDQGKPILHAVASLPNQVEACQVIQFLSSLHGTQYINQTDDAGMTPLHIAAQTGHEQTVRCLIACGANINLHDKNDKTAFELAHDAGHVNIRDALSDLYQIAVIKNYSGRDWNNRNVCYANL